MNLRIYDLHKDMRGCFKWIYSTDFIDLRGHHMDLWGCTYGLVGLYKDLTQGVILWTLQICVANCYTYRLSQSVWNEIQVRQHR